VINEVAKASDKLDYAQFKKLSSKILALLPKEEIKENDFLHKIENLALIGIEENIFLSNSVFEVKRRKIIKMDKQGAFIPLATRRIFLNYYTDESSGPECPWTKTERDNYLQEITNCLAPFITVKTTKNEI